MEYIQTQRSYIPESPHMGIKWTSNVWSPLDVSKSLRAAFIDTSSNQLTNTKDTEWLAASADQLAHRRKVMVIDVPRNIWRPKIRSKYKSSLFTKDVDEGVFIVELIGNAIFFTETVEILHT